MLLIHIIRATHLLPILTNGLANTFVIGALYASVAYISTMLVLCMSFFPESLIN